MQQVGVANVHEALSRRLQAAEAEVSRKERMGRQWDVGSISSISNASHSNASSLNASPVKDALSVAALGKGPTAARSIGSLLPELLKQAASLEAA